MILIFLGVLSLFVDYRRCLMNEMYIKSVLQQASQMMSRGEDHLLNTIQV